MSFIPDYANLEKAARNIEAPRLPLYEHIINVDQMEKITGHSFAGLEDGDIADKREFFRKFTSFFRDYGYDTVSYEVCLAGFMPHGGLLMGHGIPPRHQEPGGFQQLSLGGDRTRLFRRRRWAVPSAARRHARRHEGRGRGRERHF